MKAQSVLFALLRASACEQAIKEDMVKTCTPEMLEGVYALAAKHDLAHLPRVYTGLWWYDNYPENVTGTPSAATQAKGEAALCTLGGPGEEQAGYKGYGFAMFVELLSAILQDGSYGKALTGKGADGKPAPFHLGHFFIAIDTDHFLGEELARKKAGEIIRSVRNSTKAPGAERIYTANEKEWDVWLYRKDKGVPITEPVQKEIVAVRDELGLTQYKFPWED